MEILFLDEDVAVVHKPAGLLVHRGWAGDEDVLMTRVRDAVGRRVHPVHRLDRGASGAVVFALHKDALRILSAAFAERRVEKRYLAVVRGIPPEEVVVDHPIPRGESGPRVPAVTEVRRLGTWERYALVEAVPRTGRLHQIRRHLKHLSCPLIGDTTYGKSEHNRLFRERFGLGRLALHAASVTFSHPRTGTACRVEAPVPDDLGAVLGLFARRG